MKKLFSLMFGIFAMVLLTSSLVSASYYSNNYGRSYGYENYYDTYNYGHSYGNSVPNNRWQPNLVSIGSKDRYDDGWIYRSRQSSFRSYNSYYPGYSGQKYYDREYVLDRWNPYHSYVSENNYYESNSPYSYNQHSGSSVRLLSRPEHYVALWSYR